MTQRPSWFNETLFPFESKFMEVDGSTVHYVDVGEGPAIVMVHGNPAWSFLYRKIILGLQDRFRCIAVDNPGFGLSKAAPGYSYMPHEHSAVLGKVIDQLGLDEFTVMANDWGGPIGFGMAVERSDRVRSLIVCNTWAWPVAGVKKIERFSKVMGSSAMGFAIRRFNVFINPIMKSGFKRSKPSNEEWAMYKGPFPTPDSREPIAVLPGAILGETPWLQDISDKLPSTRRQAGSHTLARQGPRLPDPATQTVGKASIQSSHGDHRRGRSFRPGRRRRGARRRDSQMVARGVTDVEVLMRLPSLIVT